jgi:ubiquinol oxidase
LTEYEKKLKEQPVPDIARKYYERDNPFLFDLFCTVKSRSLPACDDTNRIRPLQLNNLYDVFCNIRDDENEHWKTLCNLVQFNDMNAVDATEVKSTEPIVLVTDEEKRSG